MIGLGCRLRVRVGWLELGSLQILPNSKTQGQQCDALFANELRCTYAPRGGLRSKIQKRHAGSRMKLGFWVQGTLSCKLET